MLQQHPRVVHLVDMITHQDNQVLFTVTPYDIETLKHGIGGITVPMVMPLTLLRGQKVDKHVLNSNEIPH